MAFLGQEEQLRELQDRFRIVQAVLVVGIVILVSRLVYLQILIGDRMRKVSEENRIKRVRIASPRGMIFDRNKQLLIDNHPAFDLEITPQYLRESGQSARVLAKISELIQLPVDEIQKRLDKFKTQAAFLPIKIKSDLSRDEVAKIETWKLDLPGVGVVMEIQRTNLYNDVASHLLGYISKVNTKELPALLRAGKPYTLEDSIGKFGIEKELEPTLRGIDGYEMIEVDALGRRLRTKDRASTSAESSAESTRVAQPGKNVVLTIDQDLQLAALKAFGDKAGGLVAIDPRNGEILTMISRPAFNPTDFSRGISPELWQALIKNEDRPMRDKTIQDHYAPGSTFKAVTALAGLQQGAVTPQTKFFCGGSMRVGNRTYHCHRKGGHGEVDLAQALEQSCDLYFYKLSQKLKSVNEISEWAKKLGLGRRTGVPLAREVPGLVPTEEWKRERLGQEWTGGETLSVAIGQSFVLATVLQLANTYAAIGNGGTLYRPHIVKAVENSDGELIEEIKPEIISQVQLDPKAVDTVREGLWRVVNSPRGTAYSQRLPGADIAGKTGTAQVVRLTAERIYDRCENMRYRHRHHALFSAFAPAKDPLIAVAVIAEHACHGSSGAAPIAREVIKTYLSKYYPQQFKFDDAKRKAPTAPSPTDTEDQAVHEDVAPVVAPPPALPEGPLAP